MELLQIRWLPALCAIPVFRSCNRGEEMYRACTVPVRYYVCGSGLFFQYPCLFSHHVPALMHFSTCLYWSGYQHHQIWWLGGGLCFCSPIGVILSVTKSDSIVFPCLVVAGGGCRGYQHGIWPYCIVSAQPARTGGLVATRPTRSRGAGRYRNRHPRNRHTGRGRRAWCL